MKKLIVLGALVLILFCGCIKSITAQTASSLTVPEFSIKFVSASYHNGNLTQNSSLVITVKNEPFVSFSYRNGFVASVFYEILLETVSESKTLSTTVDCYPAQSDSNYTTISLPYINDTILTPLTLLTPSRTIEVSSQLNVEVQTKIGYITPDIKSYPNTAFVFEGQSSGWSNMQTINLSETSSLVSPSVPELPVIVAIPLMVATITATFILRFKIRKPA